MAESKEKKGVDKQVTKVTKPKRPGLGKNKHISVDMEYDDVIKFDKEGYNLRFSDEEGKFKKLPAAILKQLSPESQGNYNVANALRMGIDVGMLDHGYDVTPGSAKDRMEVFNRKAGKDYYWSRTDRVDKWKQEGWKVCVDNDVSTMNGDSGSIKTIGGERRPEMVLMEIDKPRLAATKARKNQRRQQIINKTKESFKEDVRRLGGKGFDAVTD